jgi:hypothetical protein
MPEYRPFVVHFDIAEPPVLQRFSDPDNPTVYTIEKDGRGLHIRGLAASAEDFLGDDEAGETFERAKTMLQSHPFSRKIGAYKQERSPSALRELVTFAYGSLPRDQAFSFIRNYLPHRAEDYESYGVMFEMMVYCLSQCLHHDFILAEVKALIEIERVTNGESYWLHSAIACVLLNEDKTNPAAYTHFALGSAKLRGFNEAFHISSGMDAMRPLTYEPSDFAAQTRSSGLISYLTPAEKPSFVHFVAADPVYFGRYFERLASDVEPHQRDQNIVLHCHVVNPSADFFTAAKRLRDSHPWLGFSFDVAALLSASHRSRMAYYASARYIFASDILRLYDAPVVITDIDYKVEHDYTAVLQHVEGKDAAFSCGIASMRRYYPWVRVNAALALFRNTDKGRNIADHVGAYICATMDNSPGARNWLIDQIALWHAYERYSNSIGHTRLAALGRPHK